MARKWRGNLCIAPGARISSAMTRGIGSLALTRMCARVSTALPSRAAPLPNFSQPTQVDGVWRAGRFAREVAYTTTDTIQSLAVFNPDQLDIAPMGTNYDSPDVFRHVPVIDGFNRERDIVGNVTKTRLAVRIPRPDRASACRGSAHL
jgi:hypothetical protein